MNSRKQTKKSAKQRRRNEESQAKNPQPLTPQDSKRPDIMTFLSRLRSLTPSERARRLRDRSSGCRRNMTEQTEYESRQNQRHNNSP